MAEKEYGEKDEKQFDEKDEKELLKHDEKVEQRDALSSIVWAAILIWAGLVFLAVNLGWMERFLSSFGLFGDLPEGMQMIEPALWAVIMLGVGFILLAEVVIRLLVPTFKRRVIGTLILAMVFIGSGLGNFFGWELVWPFILILIGVGILLGGLLRKKTK